MAASLPFLAFEGATKKNKPQLKVVYIICFSLWATNILNIIYLMLYIVSFPCIGLS
jgi:lipid A disaccharide synthetase